MKDFFNFNKMITPTLVKIIFLLKCAFFIVSGIAIIAGAIPVINGGLAVLIGLITIIVRPLIARIYFETIMVMFKINESVEEIKSKSTNSSI